MITISQRKLRSSFLSRLKTQERAYNDIGVYYTPRLFTKLVAGREELRERLSDIHCALIDNIEVVLKNNTIAFSDIESLAIEHNLVFATLASDNSSRWQLYDTRLPDNARQHLTLDHVVPFYELIKANLGQLPALRKLTADISQGRALTKEQMREEYPRILAAYQQVDIVALLQEVKFLADKTTLRLLASDRNFAKGRKMASVPASVAQAR